MTPALTELVHARIEAVTDGDVAAHTALDRLYAATGQIEQLIPDDLWEAFDSAFCDVMDTVRAACWADGWQCGQDPARLVFAVEPMPEPIAVDWREVAPGVSIGVTAAAAVDAWLVAGGAE